MSAVDPSAVDQVITIKVGFNESVKEVNVYLTDADGKIAVPTPSHPDTSAGLPVYIQGDNSGLDPQGLVWTGKLLTSDLKNMKSPIVINISASNFAGDGNDDRLNAGQSEIQFDNKDKTEYNFV